jgi:hypothetical protein
VVSARLKPGELMLVLLGSQGGGTDIETISAWFRCRRFVKLRCTSGLLQSATRYLPPSFPAFSQGKHRLRFMSSMMITLALVLRRFQHGSAPGFIVATRICSLPMSARSSNTLPGYSMVVILKEVDATFCDVRHSELSLWQFGFQASKISYTRSGTATQFAQTRMDGHD